MARFPVISGKKLMKLLFRNGFLAIRRKGSHVFIENSNGMQGTVIPIHGNEDLGTGLLKSILDDLHLSTEDLRNVMR